MTAAAAIKVLGIIIWYSVSLLHPPFNGRLVHRFPGNLLTPGKDRKFIPDAFRSL